MKVSAANQTLILANEGPLAARSSGSGSGQSTSVPSSHATFGTGTSAAGLQRVTVVAELPDSTVVTVHADYGTSTANRERVVSSQTPSASTGEDANADALLISIADGGRAAVTASAASSAALTATASASTTGIGSSVPSSGPSLVQLSSPAYNRLLRDSDTSRDTAGNPHSSNENVALYARTERTTGAIRSSSLVDVHA